jgi:hypothetical protein
MNTKSLIITIVVAVVFAGAGFFGGMTYQKSKRVTFPSGNAAFNRNGITNTGTQRLGGTRNGMQPVSGEITAIDTKSVTVKTNDGSSKIIIFSGTTMFNRTTEGTVSDLKNGEKVMIFGTTNSDGSVTAQNISVGGTFGMMQGGQPPQQTP